MKKLAALTALALTATVALAGPASASAAAPEFTVKFGHSVCQKDGSTVTRIILEGTGHVRWDSGVLVGGRYGYVKHGSLTALDARAVKRFVIQPGKTLHVQVYNGDVTFLAAGIAAKDCA